MGSVINITAAIADQDAKCEKKLEKQLWTLSLQIKDNSLKLNEQYKQVSSIKESCDEFLSKMINNNKISTNLDTERT